MVEENTRHEGLVCLLGKSRTIFRNRRQARFIKTFGKQMKIIFLGFVFISTLALAVDRSRPVAIDSEPDPAVYPMDSQYEEPKVSFAPKVNYPFEVRAGIYGEVFVCVKIDDEGYPERIAVMRSSDKDFERNALENVRRTKWLVGPSKKKPRDGWFIRRIEFVREDE